MRGMVEEGLEDELKGKECQTKKSDIITIF